MSAPVWAIVVAGGSGQRFGAEKQFLEVAGVPLYAWSVMAARSVAERVVLVVPGGRVTGLAASLGPVSVPGGSGGSQPDRSGRSDPPDPPDRPDVVVAGGATRAESVRAGLAAVAFDAEIVLVHDAARPLASKELFRAVVGAVRSGADGAIPGLAIVDTVKRVRGAAVVETLDRSELVRVQTPQAFRADRLRAAHSSGGEASDDAHLVEALGGRVIVVPGEETNLKVTTPPDLAAAERVLATRPELFS